MLCISALALALVAGACGGDDERAAADTQATTTVAATPADPPTTTDNPTPSPQEEPTMQRTPVNPWTWSLDFGFNQAEMVEGATRELYLSGQAAMGPDGQPLHAGDMAAQLTLALDNLDAVLAEAGMSLSDVVRLNIYTTDVDALFANYGIIAERTGTAGVAPPGTLLGVARLAFPELMVELEATAVG
jgi:enamine deaminase RidA (YjgF/YER057c/UK114 family)